MKIDTYHSNGITEIVDLLCDEDSYLPVYHGINFHDVPMPSTAALTRIVDLLKSVLFPGFFMHTEIKPDTMKYYVGSTLDEAIRLLYEQVKLGFCFSCTEEDQVECLEHESKYRGITDRFISTLPRLRRMLSLDAQAAYAGDPAATSTGEVIFSYPSMTAITNHRIARVRRTRRAFRLSIHGAMSPTLEMLAARWNAPDPSRREMRAAEAELWS